jgi:hypothetical protein
MEQAAAVTPQQYDAMTQAQRDALPLASPLVLDLDGDGVSLVSLEAGTVFDLTASGQTRRVGWVGGNDGLLVLDRDGSGRIEDGRELFGSVTPMRDGSVAGDGFRALSELDTNRDGRISAADDHFSRLQVWIDRDVDGINQLEELKGLVELGITELNLDYVQTRRIDQGNLVGLVSSYTTVDGQQREMADVWFRQEALPQVPPPSLGEVLLAPSHAVGMSGAESSAAPAGPAPPAPTLRPEDEDPSRMPPLV